ncbi:MAG: dihydroorotase, partial [Candidatus Saccharicenans sp.]
MLLKQGRVLDPGERIDGIFDLLLADGQIIELKPEIKLEADRIIEARGLVIVPGFIDLHVHLREPGFEPKETIATGSRAAARGGFTTICCMPNTNPVADTPEVINFIRSKASQEAVVKVLPIAAITKNQKGQELVKMEELVAAGAVAFSDDGQPLLNSKLMREAMEKAAGLGVPVIDHCEEKFLTGDGVLNQGAISRKLNLPGIPAEAEEIMVARDIILARRSGAPVHLAHLSTRVSVELLDWAKSNGALVTAEVTPHHLLLTEDCLQTKDPVYKVNPPLRTEEDVRALRKALKEGLIDLIATDHAPH